MSPDSFDQYHQALENSYTNWHPPIMSYIWHWLIYIRKGPQGMLFIQLGMLWSTVYVLAASVSRRLWQIFIILLFFFAPFLQGLAGYIIKDVQMSFSWLLACAIIFRSTIQQRRLTQAEAILSALLLIYGTWLRHNSLPAALPLWFAWVQVVFPVTKKALQLIITFTFFILSLITDWLFLTALKPGKTHPEYVTYMYDMTGLFVKTGKNVFPASCYKNPHFDTAYLRAKYVPNTFDNIWWNADGRVMLPSDGIDHDMEFKHSWIKAIIENPATYMSMRLDACKYFLRLKNIDPFYNYVFAVYPPDNPYALKPGEHFPYKPFTKYITLQCKMPYMMPWFWLLVNIVLFVFIYYIRQKELRTVFASLLLSGILYIVPLLMLMTVDTDFRYFYWQVIVCTLAILMLIASNIKNKNAAKQVAAQ